MPTILHDEPDFQTHLKLEPDQTLRSVTRIQDQHIKASNQEHQKRDVFRPGRNSAPVHPEGARLVYWFQVHPVVWADFKRTQPDLYQALHSGDQILRERAAARIAREHPDWVACAPREIRRAHAQQNP